MKNNNLTLVSLIMPSFNTSEFIEEMISSIKAQTYENWECIIIDDHSTDNTFELAVQLTKNDPRFTVLKRPHYKPKGGNSCRNFGYTLSKGDYINWIDSDDILHPKMLELKVQALLDDPYLDFVVAQTSNFTGEIDYESLENYTPAYSIVPEKDVLLEYITSKIIFYTYGPMWRSNFLAGKVLFDEKIFIVQEWDCYIRLLMHGPRWNAIHKPLYFHRGYEHSITGGIRSAQPKYVERYLYSRDKVYQYLKQHGLINKEIQVYFFKSYLDLLTKQVNARRFSHLKTILTRLYKLGQKLDLSAQSLFLYTGGLAYLYITSRQNRLLKINLFS